MRHKNILLTSFWSTKIFEYRFCSISLVCTRRTFGQKVRRVKISKFDGRNELLSLYFWNWVSGPKLYFFCIETCFSTRNHVGHDLLSFCRGIVWFIGNNVACWIAQRKFILEVYLYFSLFLFKYFSRDLYGIDKT